MDLHSILQRLNLGKQNPNEVGRSFGPVYTEPGMASIGGGNPEIGGTMGIDHGQPFANAHIGNFKENFNMPSGETGDDPGGRVFNMSNGQDTVGYYQYPGVENFDAHLGPVNGNFGIANQKAFGNVNGRPISEILDFLQKQGSW